MGRKGRDGRKKRGAVTLKITLANGGIDTACDLLWISDSGMEEWYDEIGGQATVTQETFAGHRWLVRGQRSQQVLLSIQAQASPPLQEHYIDVDAAVPNALTESPPSVHLDDVVLTKRTDHTSVTFLNMDPRASFGMTVAGKNIVDQVRSDGLATVAKIKPGDELLTVNGIEVDGEQMLFKHLRKADHFTPIKLVWVSHGSRPDTHELNVATDLRPPLPDGHAILDSLLDALEAEYGSDVDGEVGRWLDTTLPVVGEGGAAELAPFGTDVERFTEWVEEVEEALRREATSLHALKLVWKVKQYAVATAPPPEYIVMPTNGTVVRYHSPLPEWIFTQSYRQLVGAWKQDNIVTMLEAVGDVTCGEVGAMVKDVTPPVQLDVFDSTWDPTIEIYRELSEWAASERARVLEQRRWPLLSFWFTAGDEGTGCAFSSVCEMDLAFLPELGDGREAFDRLDWQLKGGVIVYQDVNYSDAVNSTHTKTHYTLAEPPGLRTGRAPSVVNKSASGLLAQKLHVGDVIVAVDGVLITRGQWQILAILDSFEKGRDFSVAVRREGATADGTSLEAFKPSDTDPPPLMPPLHGGGARGGGGGPPCCVIL